MLKTLGLRQGRSRGVGSLRPAATRVSRQEEEGRRDSACSKAEAGWECANLCRLMEWEIWQRPRWILL